MKKTVFIIILICLLFSSGVVASNVVREYLAKETDFMIEIDGKIQDFELPVVLINDHTYIALRQLCERIGYKVDWIEEERKIQLSNGEESEKGDIISQKETALKIGRALLEERFPDTFLNAELVIDAEEHDGVWRVHYVIEREGKTEDGEITFVKGGEIFVEFRKSNGEILKIGVND